jgi:hypothetical protein
VNDFVQTQAYTLATALEKFLIYYIHPRQGGAHPAGKTYLPKRKIPSKVYLSGYTKGGIWLMEAILEELNIPKWGLEVEWAFCALSCLCWSPPSKERTLKCKALGTVEKVVFGVQKLAFAIF